MTTFMLRAADALLPSVKNTLKKNWKKIWIVKNTIDGIVANTMDGETVLRELGTKMIVKMCTFN